MLCCVQVVVHNLPWSTTWQQLKDLFKDWKVERADVVYDTWGKSRCVRVGVCVWVCWVRCGQGMEWGCGGLDCRTVVEERASCWDTDSQPCNRQARQL